MHTLFQSMSLAKDFVANVKSLEKAMQSVLLPTSPASVWINKYLTIWRFVLFFPSSLFLKIRSVVISLRTVYCQYTQRPQGILLFDTNALVCWALLDLHRGGLECGAEQYSQRRQRGTNEGQLNLITALKHSQHLFRLKTTLSPRLNLLNHLIINQRPGESEATRGCLLVAGPPRDAASNILRGTA